MKFSFFQMILLLGGVQGLFLALLIYRRQVSNKAAAFYLFTLVLLVSVLMLIKLSYYSGWLAYHEEVLLIPDVILFVLGPCLWLFVRELLRKPSVAKKQLWLHALPAIIHVFILNTLIGLHLNGTLHFLSNQHISYIFFLIEGAAIISLSAYLFQGLRLAKQAERGTNETVTTPGARTFLVGFFRIGIVLTVCWAVSFLFQFVQYDPTYLAYRIIWILLVGYVYWLAYVVIIRSDVFELPPPQKTISSEDEELIQKIRNYMITNKPYVDSSLKVADLAEQLDCTSHELSRLINQGFQMAFFDFINSYRIAYFIERRSKTTSVERSIMQLAYEAGFNSKSAFNRAFKKHKGKSPSAYFGEPVSDNNQASSP